jgi:hypothetical protein
VSTGRWPAGSLACVPKLGISAAIPGQSLHAYDSDHKERTGDPAPESGGTALAYGMDRCGSEELDFGNSIGSLERLSLRRTAFGF